MEGLIGARFEGDEPHRRFELNGKLVEHSGSGLNLGVVESMALPPNRQQAASPTRAEAYYDRLAIRIGGERRRADCEISCGRGLNSVRIERHTRDVVTNGYCDGTTERKPK